MYLLGMALVLPGAVNSLLCWVGSAAAGFCPAGVLVTARVQNVTGGTSKGSECCAPQQVRLKSMQYWIVSPVINFSTSHLGNGPKVLFSFIFLLIGEVAKFCTGLKPLGCWKWVQGVILVLPILQDFAGVLRTVKLLTNYRAKPQDCPQSSDN